MFKLSGKFKVTADLLWYVALGALGTSFLVMWVHSITGWASVEICSIGWLVSIVFMYVIHGMRAVVKQWKTEAHAPIDVIYSPGDVVDKLTILDLKMEKFQDPQKLTMVRDEAFKTTLFLAELVRSAEPDRDTLQRLSDELGAINRKQWEYEDWVRSEGGSAAAQGARSNDMIRVNKKNEINKLFGFPIETKEYRS